MAIDSYKVDNVKKGRLLALSILATIAIVALTVVNTGDTSFHFVVLRGLGVIAVVYLAMLWALRFQVTLYSLLFVLPQSLLYILSQYMFFEFFFFRRSGRVYEFIIMGVLSVLLFLGNYASFLMANVFNVSTIKEIPLIQAARTTSYFLGILSVYFYTYSILDSGIHLWIALPLLFVLYFLIIALHFKNVEIWNEKFMKNTLFQTLIIILSVVSIVFLNPVHVVGALVPTAAFYILVGIVMHKDKQLLTKLDLFLYSLAIISVFLVNIFVS